MDLKTLANLQFNPLDQAIGREIGFRRYHLQAGWYLEGARHIAQFVKERKVFGDVEDEFLKALAADYRKTWVWIFQIKGVAPTAKGRTLPEESVLLSLAQAECESARQVFRKCLETWGADPWVDTEEIKALDDANVPSWSLAQ